MGDQKIVLVVDDEQDLLDVFKLMLEKSGYLVIPCSDSMAVVDILAQRANIDAALVDLSLGREDGSMVARMIAGACPGAKVVVISGNPILSFSKKTRLDGAGIMDVVEKPISRLELVEALEN